MQHQNNENKVNDDLLLMMSHLPPAGSMASPRHDLEDREVIPTRYLTVTRVLVLYESCTALPVQCWSVPVSFPQVHVRSLRCMCVPPGACSFPQAAAIPSGLREFPQICGNSRSLREFPPDSLRLREFPQPEGTEDSIPAGPVMHLREWNFFTKG